jgi:hypothetical protein
MQTLELTRSSEGRRVYRLADRGTLRLNGLLMRSATVEADGATFTIERESFWTRAVRATDADGLVGRFEPRTVRRGGVLEWRGVEHMLEPAALIAQRYSLEREGKVIAVVQARGWWGWGSRCPVTVELPDASDVDTGLLMFAAYVVRTTADRASSDGSASTTATTSAAVGG